MDRRSATEMETNVSETTEKMEISDRLEDVFKNETIKSFASISTFKMFARSKNGLCLDESVIQQIDEDNESSVDKKLGMLRRWKEQNQKEATPEQIRSLVKNFNKAANAIIIIDKDGYLRSFNVLTKKLGRMHRLNKDFMLKLGDVFVFTTDSDDESDSTAKSDDELLSITARNDDSIYSPPNSLILLDQHLYYLRCKEVLRLKYSDPEAICEKMADMNMDHGKYPSAAACGDSIYVCGSSFPTEDPSQSAERFDVARNEWFELPDMKVARKNPLVVAVNEHIYCLGGVDESLWSAEKFDGNQWSDVSSSMEFARSLGNEHNAVLGHKIYKTGFKKVYCYDTQRGSLAVTEFSKWPKYPFQHIYNINNKLYLTSWNLVGSIQIYLVDLETKQMILVKDLKYRRFALSAFAANIQ